MLFYLSQHFQSFIDPRLTKRSDGGSVSFIEGSHENHRDFVFFFCTLQLFCNGIKKLLVFDHTGPKKKEGFVLDTGKKRHAAKIMVLFWGLGIRDWVLAISCKLLAIAVGYWYC